MSETVESPVQDELATLKERATVLGIQFHPSIGLERLREKVNAVVTGAGSNDDAPAVKADSESAKRNKLYEDAMRLVRIRVTCMNPAKSEWIGEIFTVANAVVGTVKKYVPFNSDEGWHVPNILYQMLKERQCQTFVSGKAKNGVMTRQSKLIKEFAIEVLDPLTEEELKELARRQAVAGQTE